MCLYLREWFPYPREQCPFPHERRPYPRERCSYPCERCPYPHERCPYWVLLFDVGEAPIDNLHRVSRRKDLAFGHQIITSKYRPTHITGIVKITQDLRGLTGSWIRTTPCYSIVQLMRFDNCLNFIMHLGFRIELLLSLPSRLLPSPPSALPSTALRLIP